MLTADHNVRNQVELAVEVPDPLAPHELSEPVPVRGWRQPLPEVDLAVAPYPNDLARRFQAVRIDEILPHGVVPMLGAIVYYIGIFAPLHDVPMARAGNIGNLEVPIEKTYDTHTYRYTGHLLDCRSYDGFSGSPCFVQTLYATDTAVASDRPLQARNGTPPTLRALAWTATFAGLFTAHYTDEDANPEGLPSRYGVGVILSSDYVWEALMTDEAQDERREWDEQWHAEQAASQPPLRNASARTTAKNDEFVRFDALTRQLVQTPRPPNTK
ncbi:MAG: hypothetical protein ABSG93_06405 [Solirubrobacteraceae bacterium]